MATFFSRCVLRLMRRPVVAAVGAGLAGAFASNHREGAWSNAWSRPEIESWHASPEAAAQLPTFTKAEVARHASAETGIWVTFRGGVYDITQFVQNHPGGVDKILMAAGGSVEPFWRLYRQHLQTTCASGALPVPKDLLKVNRREFLVGAPP